VSEDDGVFVDVVVFNALQAGHFRSHGFRALSFNCSLRLHGVHSGHRWSLLASVVLCGSLGGYVRGDDVSWTCGCPAARPCLVGKNRPDGGSGSRNPPAPLVVFFLFFRTVYTFFFRLLSVMQAGWSVMGRQ
jgi:hypothetical protein